MTLLCHNRSEVTAGYRACVSSVYERIHPHCVSLKSCGHAVFVSNCIRTYAGVEFEKMDSRFSLAGLVWRLFETTGLHNVAVEIRNLSRLAEKFCTGKTGILDPFLITCLGHGR